MDIITNQYLVCHYRKGVMYSYTCNTMYEAKSLASNLHHVSRMSLGETSVYMRDDGDWLLIEQYTYNIVDNKLKTVRNAWYTTTSSVCKVMH